MRLTFDVDIVVRLTPDNAAKGIHALFGIGYQLAVPVTPETFADAATRERWREEKNMLVLKLRSDEHRRTPIDIFVYEPFEFEAETLLAEPLEVLPGLWAPVVSLGTLLAMKRTANRPKDLIDVEELERAR